MQLEKCVKVIKLGRNIPSIYLNLKKFENGLEFTARNERAMIDEVKERV